MKRINKCLLGLGCLASLPVACLTSCNKQSQKSIETRVYVNKDDYFAKQVEVSNVYKDNEFSFTFTLNDGCYVDAEASYVRCGAFEAIDLNNNLIQAKLEGNKYTYTVDKSVVTGDFVIIYIYAYKTYAVDVSQSSSDISFSYVPMAIENKRYRIGFKVTEGKGLDLKNSVITVGSTVLNQYQYLAYEEVIGEERITVIEIPSIKVNNDISLKLTAASSTTTSITSRPEYSSYYLSNPVVGNDFYCYFKMADKYNYELDIDKAVIKSGETTLVANTDYSFDTLESTGYTFLKINGNKIEQDKLISIDVPVIEIFNCYPCHWYEAKNIAVLGDSFNKQKDDYQFMVIPLNDKSVDWSNADTYISVGDKKLYKGDTLASGTFTVSIDSETGYEVVTVAKDDTIDNLYCHFITK